MKTGRKPLGLASSKVNENRCNFVRNKKITEDKNFKTTNERAYSPRTRKRGGSTIRTSPVQVIKVGKQHGTDGKGQKRIGKEKRNGGSSTTKNNRKKKKTRERLNETPSAGHM